MLAVGATVVLSGLAPGPASADFPANTNVAELDGRDGFRLAGAAAGDYAGYSVSGAGDVNGDGLDDLLIAAVAADGDLNLIPGSGASYVLFGKDTATVGLFPANLNLAALNGLDGFRLAGIATNDFSGGSVSDAGHVNGDGLADLLIGAYRADANGTDSGASYVVFGRRAAGPADTTPPTITPSLTDLQGNDGWYTADLTLSFAVSESESPGSLTTTGCEMVTVSSDTGGLTHAYPVACHGYEHAQHLPGMTSSL